MLRSKGIVLSALASAVLLVSCDGSGGGSVQDPTDNTGTEQPETGSENPPQEELEPMPDDG
ncbi:MAG: hypothetical protein ACPGSC_09180, partial [Granulosicoccaceae bacterium]